MIQGHKCFPFWKISLFMKFQKMMGNLLNQNNIRIKINLILIIKIKKIKMGTNALFIFK